MHGKCSNVGNTACLCNGSLAIAQRSKSMYIPRSIYNGTLLYLQSAGAAGALTTLSSRLDFGCHSLWETDD